MRCDSPIHNARPTTLISSTNQNRKQNHKQNNKTHMAKVSFDIATAASATQPIEQSVPSQAVQVIPAPSALPSNQLGDEGPVDLSQIRLPKINIVQRIGELSTRA